MAGYNRRRKKKCFFCKNTKLPSYKDVKKLTRYMSDTGKILPRRATGNCPKHQRRIASRIKRARHLALLPYVIK